MTQIILDPGLLKLLKEKFQNHPVYSRLDIQNHTKRVDRVLYDFVNEDYITVHKDEINDMIKNAIAGFKNDL